MIVAIYARYSSDLQNDRSIEDQVALCRKLIKNKELGAVSDIRVYEDRAISGSFMDTRPGLLNLLNDVDEGRVKYIVTEALDRLARNLKHIAGFYDTCLFNDVEIITSMEGAIGKIHIGLTGTMSSIALDQTSDRVRRGQAGNIRVGKAANRPAFGYRIVYMNKQGLPEKGLREIDPYQAQTIKRIYAEFINGKSTYRIARRLNEDGILTGEGNKWLPQSIKGSWGTTKGILQNPIYKGVMIYNRNKTKRNPITGKTHLQKNDKNEWVTYYDPKLRIISDEDWDLVQKIIKKKRQKQTEIKGEAYEDIGIKITCGRCGGTMTKQAPSRLVCSSWKRQKSCDQNHRISLAVINEALYEHLSTNLDLIWLEWQKAATVENKLRKKEHKKRHNQIYSPTLIALNMATKKMLFQSIRDATDDQVRLVRSIFNTAAIDLDNSGQIIVRQTTPDWEAMAQI